MNKITTLSRETDCGIILGITVKIEPELNIFGINGKGEAFISAAYDCKDCDIEKFKVVDWLSSPNKRMLAGLMIERWKKFGGIE